MRYSKPIFPEGHGPSTRAEMMRGYKAFLKVEEERIFRRHRTLKEGLRVCQERTELIDHIIRSVWKDLPGAIDPPLVKNPPVCIMATGGYARGIMNRHSDIDINFMLAGNSLKLPPGVQQFIGAFTLFLTDIGFKVGHVTDCVGGRIQQANEDNLTKTSLVVTRFIIGATEPYAQLQARFVKECIAGQEVQFLRAQVDELVRRHEKHENTPFVQQPDVKEGCGGLRDYQNLVWVAFAKFRISDLSELQGLKLLDKRSWNELNRAHDFILMVRNEMHYHERRAQDRLGLKLQGPVATRLGYKGTRMIERIEAFMHDYYMHVRNILRQSSKLMDRFNLEVLKQGETKSSLAATIIGALRRTSAKPGAKEKSEHFDGFHSLHGRVFADDDRIFTEDPHRLMRLFMHTQQRHLRLSPDLFDLVCNTGLVGKVFRYNKDVRETFLGILDHKGDVARVLRQMHRCDFLGRYLPEFGALTCRVQHEFFHSYTADEHTLRCIDHLDELAGKSERSLEFYQHLFREMHDPAVLYLALILHDTGRAANKATHSDESTMLADKVCRRLQIKGQRRNQILFLVDNHLLMYLTATKKNPDDPEVIKEFASIVKTRENLDALTVMTMADIKGVGGNAFTGYKDASLRGLYTNAMRFLDAPADFMKRATVPLDDLKAEVLGELSKGYAAELDAHFANMPRAYFNFRKPSTIAKHLRQFRAFYEQVEASEDETALMPLMRWEDKPLEGCSKLMVCGWDRHLLLARVAGALAAENLRIVSADFYQRADHLVLDVFRVSTTTFEPVTSETARKRVQKSVLDALRKDEFDFSCRIASRRKPVPGLAEIEAEIPQWVYVNNNISPDHTVIELQAIDRIGLLYDVFMVIGILGYSVTHARIGTEKGVAVDAIYIQDMAGAKITDREASARLKLQLESTVLGKGKAAS